MSLFFCLPALVMAADVKTAAVTTFWQDPSLEHILNPLLIDGNVLYAQSRQIFLAVDISGRKQKWRIELKSGFPIVPVLAAGRLYYIDGDEVVVADSSSGKVIVRKNFPNALLNHLRVAGPHVFIQSWSRKLYVLDNASLNEVWSYPAGLDEKSGGISGGAIVTGPIVAGDSVIAWLPDNSIASFAIADGKTQWQSSRLSLASAPILGGDRLFFTVEGERRSHYGVALDPANGNEIWRSPAVQPPSNLPVVSGEQIIMTTNGGAVSISLRDGSVKWRYFIADNPIHISPSADANFAYFADGHNITAVDVHNGQKAWDIPFTKTHEADVLLQKNSILAGSSRAVVQIAFPDVFTPPLEKDVISVQWRYPLVGEFWSLPRLQLSADTIVAVAPGAIHAINRGTGERRWIKEDEELNPPAVQGDAVFVTHRNRIEPMVPPKRFDIVSGKELNSESLPQDRKFYLYNRPLAARDRLIFSGTKVVREKFEEAESSIMAVSPDLTHLLWKVPMGGQSQQGEPIATLGDLVFYTILSQKTFVLHALDLDTGKARWTTPLDYILSAPMVQHKDVIFIPNAELLVGHGIGRTGKGELLAVSSVDGALRWKKELSGVPTAVAIDEASAFVSTSYLETLAPSNSTNTRATVRAFDIQSGNLNWQMDFRTGSAGGVVFIGKVLVAAGDGALVGLEAATGLELWRYEIGEELIAPPIAMDDTIYLQTISTVLAVKVRG